MTMWKSCAAPLGLMQGVVHTERTKTYASLEHVFQNDWTGRVVLTYASNDFDS